MTDTPQTLVITRVRDQARLTRSFDLRCVEKRRVEFVPGQVAILGVGEEQPAYFAFAGAPDDPDLEVLVKQRLGASKVLYDLREGDEIKLLGIAGRGFSLAEEKHRDLVFVGMGTGVAPLRSALRHVLNHRKDFGQLVVLYGARTPEDFC